MEKYLFLFYGDEQLLGWECFDPHQKVSEGLAVQIAFNMLVHDDCYDHALIYTYRGDDDRLLICTISK